MKSKKLDLTVCSVITPAHRMVLHWNVMVSRSLNPGISVPWVTVAYDYLHVSQKAYDRMLKNLGFSPEELPPKKYQKLVSEDLDLAALCPEMTLVPGPSRKEIVDYLRRDVPKKFPKQELEFRTEKCFASYAHAAGLERALESVKTRFVLLLDPDFYLVRPKWMEEIPRYMNEKGLAFFGVPWHPRWFQKYRDFPCVHCLFIDRDRIPLPPGSLAPTLISDPTRPSTFWREYLEMGKRRKRFYLAQNLSTAWKEDKAQRETIGRSQDTGYKLYAEYGRTGKAAFECAIPVFDPKRDGYRPKSVAAIQTAPVVERLFPPEKRYYPSSPVTRLSFVELGLPDVRSRDWEEFFWRGAPFGFHMRGEQQREQKGSMRSKKLLRILDRVLAWNGAPQLETLAPESIPLAEPPILKRQSPSEASAPPPA